MALRKKANKNTAEKASVPNKYIKNDSVSYDSKVDITEEYNARSKELANEGIDFVSKGTIHRSQAERMLKEGKALKDISKELFSKGEENLALAKENRNTGQEEKDISVNIQKNIDKLNKEIKKQQKEYNVVWNSATKHIDKADILHGEGTEQTERAANTLREADNMLEEAEKLYQLGQKEIDKGNTLIDKSKSTSNIPKKDIGKYSEEHFTGEIELDKDAMQAMEEAKAQEEKAIEEARIAEEEKAIEEAQAKEIQEEQK